MSGTGLAILLREPCGLPCGARADRGLAKLASRIPFSVQRESRRADADSALARPGGATTSPVEMETESDNASPDSINPALLSHTEGIGKPVPLARLAG